MMMMTTDDLSDAWKEFNGTTTDEWRAFTGLNETNITTCNYSPWLVETPEGPRMIGWASAVLYVVYVLATLGIYWKKQKKLPLLKRRMHTLVVWSSLASLIIVAWSSVRFIVGVLDYPCTLWLWMILLTVPANATPLVLRLVQLNFRYSFANKVRALTGALTNSGDIQANFDEVALRRLVTMKERMEMRWSCVVGIVVVVTSTVVSIPGYLIGYDLRPSNFHYDPNFLWYNPPSHPNSRGMRGVGCGVGCGDTKGVVFVLMGYIGVAIAVCVLSLLRMRKEGRDKFGVKKELMLASMSWTIWILSYIVFWAVAMIAQWSATGQLAVYVMLKQPIKSPQKICTTLPLCIVVNKCVNDDDDDAMSCHHH